MGLFDNIKDIKDKLMPGKKDFPELEAPAQKAPSGMNSGDIELEAPPEPDGINESSGFKALPNNPPIDSPGGPTELPPLPDDEPAPTQTPGLESRGFAPEKSDSASKAEFEIIKAKLEAVNAKLDRIADMVQSMKPHQRY
ncbi:MAG: hypothetical protein PHW96_04030 [Candidatus Nanoarchaeia archaeon]|nr:hypothetical protein [Candidatus Nanoarchaeia archaeon]